VSRDVRRIDFNCYQTCLSRRSTCFWARGSVSIVNRAKYRSYVFCVFQIVNFYANVQRRIVRIPTDARAIASTNVTLSIWTRRMAPTQSPGAVCSKWNKLYNLASDVSAATQKPFCTFPPWSYTISLIVPKLPIVHTALWHVSRNLNTNNVKGAMVLRLPFKLYGKMTTGNCDVESRSTCTYLNDLFSTTADPEWPTSQHMQSLPLTHQVS
jgi:hypothetical protein